MEASVENLEQFSMLAIGKTVAEVERAHILETLRYARGNRTHASNLLGISIRTLRNKLNEYATLGSDIPPPPPAGRVKMRRNLDPSCTAEAGHPVNSAVSV